MIRSAEFRDKSRILTPSSDVDEYGKPGVNTFLRNMRCNVQIISGTELIKSGATLSTEYISVKARFDSRLTQQDIFEWLGNEYQIDMIRPIERRRAMIITGSREFLNER